MVEYTSEQLAAAKEAGLPRGWAVIKEGDYSHIMKDPDGKTYKTKKAAFAAAYPETTSARKRKAASDAAAALVTGEEDARVKSKDAEKRKSVLLPSKLQHAYRVVGDISQSVSGEIEDEGAGDESDLSVAERNEERRIAATIQTMWDTMVTMDVAKPTIIFPGRVGVERVQEELKARGLGDVRTLRNLSGDSDEDSDEDDVTELTNNWKHVPVYVIGERFARGLDLPEVGNVILLTPPSSAAGYAHMVSLLDQFHPLAL